MKKIIIANWKMNPASLAEANRLFAAYKRIKSRAEIVVCPPYVFLSEASRVLAGRKGLALGAQDCFWGKQGPFTGQISPLALKSLGVKYVILGHSEQRTLGETNEIVNRKIKAVLSAGLRPIVCLGETKAEREQGNFLKVLEKQVKECLTGVPKAKISNALLVYEPTWAVGTKNPCSVDDALTAELFLRKLVSNNWGKAAARGLRVLYGGSVDGENAKTYLASDWIGGLLVGAASLNPKTFSQIIKI